MDAKDPETSPIMQIDPVGWVRKSYLDTLGTYVTYTLPRSSAVATVDSAE